MEDANFDMQAAWLRRFRADVESNLKAFALRLKEAMPEMVTVHETRGLFSKSARITGVTVELGEHHYGLAIENGRLKATIAMVVHGIALNTKDIEPGDWFAKLSAETRKVSEHAQALSASLTSFMAG
jgi:hypothetical protein